MTPDRKSDNLISVRTVTATEASRSFAALLDEVEHGETVVVTRGGRRIATIGPAGAGNGAAVRAFLLGELPEPAFARAVRAAREAGTFEGIEWPED
jgi:prevent-host-death family protein